MPEIQIADLSMKGIYYNIYQGKSSGKLACSGYIGTIQKHRGPSGWCESFIQSLRGNSIKGETDYLYCLPRVLSSVGQ